MPTQLHLQEVLNFKENWESALKSHFSELGFTDIFTSTDEGDMPDDMLEIIFNLAGQDGVGACPAQQTGTGNSEACYYNGTIEITLAVLRLQDNGTSRPPTTGSFKNLLTERACLIKYGMLAGALVGGMNGLSGLSLPYYDFRYMNLTGEEYGVTEEYVKDTAQLTYSLGFAIRGDAWKG